MGGMTEGVEQQIEKRMADFDLKFRATDQRLEQLSPRLDHISTGFSKINSVITGDLASALQVHESLFQLPWSILTIPAEIHRYCRCWHE